MEITLRALKQIKNIKARQGLSRNASLRLGLNEDGVFLKWDCLGPGGDDLIVMGQGCPMFLDAITYSRLADYVLDYDRDAGSPRFLLRPRRETTKAGPGRNGFTKRIEL